MKGQENEIKESEILGIKAKIFDIIEAQEQLQQQYNELNRQKQTLLKELQELIGKN